MLGDLDNQGLSSNPLQPIHVRPFVLLSIFYRSAPNSINRVSLKNHVVVKIVAAYVGVSFVAMEILYFGVWCRQFPQYWAVPPKSSTLINSYPAFRCSLFFLYQVQLLTSDVAAQCSAATNHLITNAVLNISSDIMIICIPLPMLIQSQLPLKRKAVLCVVFALGVFTVSRPNPSSKFVSTALTKILF